MWSDKQQQQKLVVSLASAAAATLALMAQTSNSSKIHLSASSSKKRSSGASSHSTSMMTRKGRGSHGDSSSPSTMTRKGRGSRGDSSSPRKQLTDYTSECMAETPPPTSIFAMMASKRLAKQLATKMYAKRGDSALDTTYQMQPIRKFDCVLVKEIIRQQVEYRLHGFKYSGRRSSMMAKVLSEEIKDQIKLLEFDRYKVICLVTLGEKKNQDFRLASRCAWDVSCDNSATFTWQNMDSFCTVTVYGLYHE